MDNSGVVVGGLQLAVPGVVVRNYRDDPRIRLRMGEDGTRRPRPFVTLITLHTTLGAPDATFTHPQTVIDGRGPSTDAGRALVEMWSTDHRCAGAALAVDFDGVVYCLADLLLEETYNATTVNARNVGVEYRQGRASELYSVQLEAGRRLVDWLTIYFGIQRQVPGAYKGRALARLASGAFDFVGVCGHRDQSDNRGAGDPGDAIMRTLRYPTVDVEKGADLVAWKRRQAWLGFEPAACDGIPGPHTVAALRARGFVGGLWACPPFGVRIPPELGL